MERILTVHELATLLHNIKLPHSKDDATRVHVVLDDSTSTAGITDAGLYEDNDGVTHVVLTTTETS
jgi:hypothetical protein